MPIPSCFALHIHTHPYSDPTRVGFGPIEKAKWCPTSVKSIDNRVHIRGMIPGSSHLQYILKALNTYCIIRIIYLTLNIKGHACMVHGHGHPLVSRHSHVPPPLHYPRPPRTTNRSERQERSIDQSIPPRFKIMTQIVREDLPDIEVEGGNRLQFSGTNSIPIWVTWSWFSVGTCWFVLLFRCWGKFKSFVK